MKALTAVIKTILILGLFLVISFPAACTPDPDSLTRKQQAMIEKDLKARGIDDPKVLAAMRKVKRHLFVDKNRQRLAYNDYPLPIGEGQTISQPYIVALMTQSLGLKNSDRVLEIGTGSGYQAAVLAEIAAEVYTIEIKKKLADKAEALLDALGYANIRVKAGDGFDGWPEYAPYDAIILTCAVNKIPRPLIDQLKPGGRIILPLGGRFQIQKLVIATKSGQQVKRENMIPVRFVPMTGKAEKIN